MNINCERIYIKRIISVSIAILIYTLAELYNWETPVQYSLPIIALFATNSWFSYIPCFSRMIHISRDSKCIVISYGKKQIRYEHNNQDSVRLIEASALANYNELLLFLPKKKLHFVLSVYEKEIHTKINKWNTEKDYSK